MILRSRDGWKSVGLGGHHAFVRTTVHVRAFVRTAFASPPPVRLCFPGLGAGRGSSPPDAAAAPASRCGCCARVRRGGGGGGGGGCCISSVGVLCTFGIHLVLELALDDLGLGATAGALNPLDVLVILVGCQDYLQLRVCYLKESGFIWVYTSTITLSC